MNCFVLKIGKCNINIKYLFDTLYIFEDESYNNMYNNIYYSNSSKNVLKDTVNKEMEFYETESLPALENSLDIREAFTKLINLDKDLYNRILQYEPINIENLRSTLQAYGFKCKLPNLMNFLDEQVHIF